MKLLRCGCAGMAVLTFAVHLVAQSGTCQIDAGNACLWACHEFVNGDIDVGSEYSGGTYKLESVNQSCTEECSFRGPGINFLDPNRFCESGNALRANAARLHSLLALAHGRPILISGCGEGLQQLQVVLAKKTKEWSLDTRKRTLDDLRLSSAKGR